MKDNEKITFEETNVKPGEFPYPIIEGPKESRYLTWVRNHSNYMATRGFLDWVRIAAVLIRGILINFISLLPFLLLLALVLGVAYETMLRDWAAQIGDRPEFFLTKTVTCEDGWVYNLQEALGTKPPYLLTPLAIALAAIWVILFPFVSRMLKIASYKRVLETGSGSSVKLRDLFERSFGAALLLIVGLAILETLPLVVHYYNHHLNFAWPGGISKGAGMSVTFAGAMAALAGASKLLSSLGGLKQKLALLLIGVLGLLIPFIVVIEVSAFLVYAEETSPTYRFLLLVIPILLAVGIVFSITVGLVRRTFRLREYPRLFGLLLLTVPLFAFAIIVIVTGSNAWYIFAWATVIWVFCWLFVDINLTSVHGLYRDRLASAYLMGKNTDGDVDIEEDVDLQELSCHEAGSVAPYHLVNVALNLQGSRDISIRERNSDFFIFSKKFIGGHRTGYCRTESMEEAFPQIDLPSAMAISAAAASPNMGSATNPLLVAFMTLLNIRLGSWLPNPGLLEERRAKSGWKRKKNQVMAVDKPGFAFDEVFAVELLEVKKRWEQCYGKDSQARQLKPDCNQPTVKHALFGVGFSGGGIRSATVNMGIVQALHRHGVIDHVDYMSTVSGGGYLGSSISALMRQKTPVTSEIAGEVSISKEGGTTVTIRDAETGSSKTYRYSEDAVLDPRIKEGAEVKVGQRILRRPGLRLKSEIAGYVTIDEADHGVKSVQITNQTAKESRTYTYSRFDRLIVKDHVEEDAPLIAGHRSLLERFRWRVRPRALLHEMLGKLDETHLWVNLSDEGHIENLAGMELLRRRCKYIIIGDGEADPNHYFGGLATLIRFARIDLGIKIEIDADELRLSGTTPDAAEGSDEGRTSKSHWAHGTITYPGEKEIGHLLYLKSSVTGDEDEVVTEYRHRNPSFPHESTADQFFDEGQFEAYRALGEHIGENVLKGAKTESADGKLTFEELGAWFESLGSIHSDSRQ